MTRPLQPCGTPAAAQRHYRNGEPLDDACQAAVRAQWSDREGGRPGARTRDLRQIRNGLPEFVPYTYRGTGYDTLTAGLGDGELALAGAS